MTISEKLDKISTLQFPNPPLGSEQMADHLKQDQPFNKMESDDIAWIGLQLGIERSVFCSAFREWCSLQRHRGRKDIPTDRTIRHWRVRSVKLYRKTSVSVQEFLLSKEFEPLSGDDARIHNVIEGLRRRLGEAVTKSNIGDSLRFEDVILRLSGGVRVLGDLLRSYVGVYRITRKRLANKDFVSEVLIINNFEENSYLINREGLIYRGKFYLNRRTAFGIFVCAHKEDVFLMRYIVLNLSAQMQKKMLTGIVLRVGDISGDAVASPFLLEELEDIALRRESIVSVLSKRDFIEDQYIRRFFPWLGSFEMYSSEAAKYRNLLDNPLVAPSIRDVLMKVDEGTEPS